MPADVLGSDLGLCEKCVGPVSVLMALLTEHHLDIYQLHSTVEALWSWSCRPALVTTKSPNGVHCSMDTGMSNNMGIC